MDQESERHTAQVLGPQLGARILRLLQEPTRTPLHLFVGRIALLPLQENVLVLHAP